MTEKHSFENNRLTTGVIWKELLRFFFPILLATFFQMLYNTVDAVIVGRYLGKEALAAVGGGTATAINLLIGFFTGLAGGATVILSQYFGGKDAEKVQKAIHNAAALAFWGGLLISVAGYFATPLLLKIIGTPEDVFPLAVRYMRIFLSGSLVVVIYNIGSATYRAFGDSTRPLIFLAIGCTVNIFLDILFVAVFALNVEGAAIASVISQLISSILIIIGLKRRNDCCQLHFSSVKFDSKMLARTLQIGLPSGVQSIMYSVSNLMIQTGINSYGTDTAAAWAAYGRLDAIFWMICNSFGIAITTFVGQNFGANQIERSKRGVKECLIMTYIATIFLQILYFVFAEQGFKLFVSDPNVIAIGTKILKEIVPFYLSWVLIEIYSGAIRGTGKTFIPTVFSVLGICGLRTIWIATRNLFAPTVDGLLACYPITWTITGIAFIIYYKRGKIYTNS